MAAAASRAAAYEEYAVRNGDDGPNSATGIAAVLPPAATTAADAGRAPAAWPSRDVCLYQRCYCEENVWKLAHALMNQLQLPPAWRLFAVVISNLDKTVPLWRQRSAAAPTLPVLWDYHVLLLAQLDGQTPLVFDLDSTLPFPCSLREYRHAALLGDDISLAPQYRRCYRVVPARLFLSHFASDRSHMVGQGGEGWLAPPPPWPCLVAESGARNTLPSYLDFSELGKTTSAGAHVQAEVVMAGKGGPEGEAGEQRARRRWQQQDGSQHCGIAAQNGGLAVPCEDGPLYGTLLREQAFLRLFAVEVMASIPLVGQHLTP